MDKFKFSTNSSDKKKVFQQAAKILLDRNFRLIDLDIMRPWGFFLSVDESQAKKFIEQFYAGARLGIDTSLPLRPKFLGIAPERRLSWQYHHHRAETWRTLAGSYNLILSDNNDETPPKLVTEGEIITIPQGTRHRGAGLESWALVAEIWQHTDPSHPSDETDIVRIQDDFGRS